MQLVLVEGGVVWSGAKYLRQLAARSATEKIHLPETILCGGVTLSEVKVLVVLCFDVRNATLIAADRDAILDALYLNSVLLGRCLA